MNIISKCKEVLKQEGLNGLSERVLRNMITKIKRNLYSNHGNKDKWKDLKGKYKGERVFLIGNGPSINITPLHLLKNEYTMCFNRINLMFERISWLPTFYMVVDSLVAKNIKSDINDIVDKVNYSFFPDIHKNGMVFRKFISDKDNILWFYPYFGKFSRNLPIISSGGSVIYEGLQVLLHLGFSEIILIGVDMNYKLHKTAINIKDVKTKSKNAIKSKFDDDPNHFDPRYFGKGKEYHQPEEYIVNSIMNSLKYAQTEFCKSGTKIINAGYNSAVNFFPKKDFRELFSYDDEQEEKLFNESIKYITDYLNINDLIENSIKINEFIDEKHNNKNIYTDMTTGVSLINKLVFSHIPLGPYKNMYFFIRRKEN